MDFALTPIRFVLREGRSVDGTGPTLLRLTIEVSDVRREAASAVAGLDLGWSQLLDALQEALADDS